MTLGAAWRRGLVCAAWLVTGWTACGQVPRLGDDTVIWERADGRGRLRIHQVPKGVSALIPIRFFLEAEGPGGADEPVIAGVEGPQPLIYEYKYTTIEAVEGAEATLAYPLRRHELVPWDERIAETRETFRAAGRYRVTFVVPGNETMTVSAPVDVRAYAYIDFGREIAMFIGGCLVVGGMMFVVLVVLRRREAASGPGHALVGEESRQAAG